MTKEELAALKSKAHTVFTGTVDELSSLSLKGFAPSDRVVVVIVMEPRA